MPTNKKFFHFINATVVFRTKVGKDKYAGPDAMPLNTVMTTEKDCIPSAGLARAQQAAQLALFQRVGDQAANVEVADVVIHNIMNLGYMTDEEFNAKPEATEEDKEALKKELALQLVR